MFRWGLFALKPHLPHYLIDNFCSADLFALALTNFCSAIFVPLFLFHWGLFALNLNQFLFRYFCSAIFVPLFLFCWGLFLFCYFCLAGPFFSTMFVPLFLFHWGIFLFRYFCSLGPFFVPLFLFRYFCSTDLFALALTNFCSATFVLLFLFRWDLFALKIKSIFVLLFFSAIFVPLGPFFVLLFLFH